MVLLVSQKTKPSWGWFPSAAFAWKMKEEDFLKRQQSGY
jgi:hypothetical protein